MNFGFCACGTLQSPSPTYASCLLVRISFLSKVFLGFKSFHALHFFQTGFLMGSNRRLPLSNGSVSSYNGRQWRSHSGGNSRRSSPISSDGMRSRRRGRHSDSSVSSYNGRQWRRYSGGNSTRSRRRHSDSAVSCFDGRWKNSSDSSCSCQISKIV